MNKNNSVKAKLGGSKTPNRRGLYAKAAKYAVKSIEVLVDLMENSRNDSVRVSAAKALLDKSLPDIKAVEFEAKNQAPIKLIIDMGNGYIPPNSREITTS